MRNKFGLLLLALFTISSNSGVYAQAPLPPLARRAVPVDDRFVAPVTPKTDRLESDRLIVKLQPQFAAELEAELPGSMTLSLESARGETVRSFLNKCSARSLAPIYPQLVRLKRKQGLSGRALAEQIRQRFARRARRLEKTFNPPDISRTYVLKLATSDAREKLRVLSLLRKDARVEFAEEDAVASITYSPNDPYFSTHGSWGQSYDDLWGLKKINAPSAWDTAAGEGITVAVVDTGLDASHPDIQANAWRNSAEIAGNLIDDDNNGFVDDIDGWNFSYETNNPADDHGHGTHVAGTIAAVGNNGIGVIGVAYKAKIMPVKGLDRNGNGWDSGLANALIYAANNGADVINNSWRGFGESQLIAEAVSYAYNMGMVVIAAAGNDFTDAYCCTPANRPESITIAASTPEDDFAYFSNFGDKIDVAAPGVNVLSLRAAGTTMGGPTVGTQYIVASGTSMAAPHASGVAALILSRHPEFSSEQVRQVMRASANDPGDLGYDLKFGYGVLNSSAALTFNDALEVKILAPSSGIEMAGPLEVSGFARGTRFASYRLDSGSGTAPSEWTTFFNSSTPASGALGIFDPALLADGKYVLRLTAYDTEGHEYADRITVIVRTTKITSPLAPNAPTSSNSYKPGASIAITGTADGADFANFEVHWARGLNVDTGWKTDGITLTGGGTKPVSNGVLANWDTTGISAADYYTIRLTLHRGAIANQARTIVYLQPGLQSIHWPRLLDPGPYASSGVVPALNADGSFRLVVAGAPGWTRPASLWTLSPDGAFLTRFPMPNLFSGSTYQPSAAQIDGLPGQEVVIADYNFVRVFRENGTTIPLAPPPLSYLDFARARLVVDDLNGDSKFEILASAPEWATGTNQTYGWKADGSAIGGNFPIVVQDNNDIRGYYNHSRMLVGDLDDDGTKEIVVAEGLTTSTFQLRLFAPDGSPKTWNSPVFDGMPWALVAADLDHNGKLEVLVVANQTSYFALHVLQPDGTERPGWPFTIQNLYGGGKSFLAVADFDNDGFEQILLTAGNYLYLLDVNGVLHPGPWPLQIGSIALSGPAVIGDVDGDGYQDIVTVQNDIGSTSDPFFRYGGGYYDQKLIVVQRDGTISRSWQLTARDGFDLGPEPVPAIGDFNQDGKTEIAVLSEIFGPDDPRGVVSVFNTGANYNPSLVDWPLYLRDARNSGVLRRKNYKAASAVVLTSSSNPALLGQTITLTAKASAATEGPVILSGSIEFYDSSALMGTAVLDEQGEASITTNELSNASHRLSARYVGNENFYGSYSAPLWQIVASPDFSLSGSGPRTVRAGETAPFTISVAPNPGPYNSPVNSFTCTGLPRGAACRFSASSVTLGDLTAALDLSVSTTARSVAASNPRSNSLVFAMMISGSVIIFGLMSVAPLRRLRGPMVVAITCCALLLSCGGGGGSHPPPPQDHSTPAGTYTITVSAIGEGVSHTTTVTMTVQ